MGLRFVGAFKNMSGLAMLPDFISNYGRVTEAVTNTENYNRITEAVTITDNFGEVI